ncbi:uncharacterized SAM-binding protein YcdF (DUF218 family) [Actinoplanes tereljensis]|uniref:DUF218 domain-containing protein n=1 Tax=Paractinoplanes tereljensis TaxID=571912 RepID=A0A919NVZ1_9ACTN|nr:YdcF family protein [Actinoplanes tereljensis]GIF26304.1 hypothetical protein Ate02nite_90340 [Actinoplanes tereljensis]
MTAAIARSVNTLVRFCARRDVPSLTAGLADVAILFGGTILAGADVFAAAMRAGVADRYLIVGGQGHTTDALRAVLGDGLSEAALLDRYLRERYGLAADLLEQESTNCGNNVTNALALLRAEGVRHDRLVLVQDGTMQQRMDAGFRRHAAPSTRIVNYASHRTFVDDSLRYRDEPVGMWPLDRYVSLLLGEIPRLTGYGPAGRDFIAHVEVPPEVQDAADYLRDATDYTVRTADARWA